MRIEFTSRNYTPSEKLKDVVTRKIDKLDKFFDDDVTAKVVFKKSKDIEIMEITVFVTGNLVRAEVSGKSMYKNIDLALPKLEKQIIRHYDKIKSKKFNLKDLGLGEETAAPAEEKKVVREKSYKLVPMTVEDAIEEMELVGHDFYVFANRETGNVNVLYARNDGDYGLIEAVQ